MVSPTTTTAVVRDPGVVTSHALVRPATLLLSMVDPTAAREFAKAPPGCGQSDVFPLVCAPAPLAMSAAATTNAAPSPARTHALPISRTISPTRRRTSP